MIVKVFYFHLIQLVTFFIVNLLRFSFIWIFSFYLKFFLFRHLRYCLFRKVFRGWNLRRMVKYHLHFWQSHHRGNSLRILFTVFSNAASACQIFIIQRTRSNRSTRTVRGRRWPRNFLHSPDQSGAHRDGVAALLRTVLEPGNTFYRRSETEPVRLWSVWSAEKRSDSRWFSLCSGVEGPNGAAFAGGWFDKCHEPFVSLMFFEGVFSLVSSLRLAFFSTLLVFFAVMNWNLVSNLSIIL